MQGDVACNASPLIFLAKIKKLSLLDIYSLHVPSQVETEILKGLKRKREDAKLIIAYLSQKNIKPVKAARKGLSHKRRIAHRVSQENKNIGLMLPAVNLCPSL